MRSHDQFNTTIYGFSDRYRGIEGGRRVVFVNPQDIQELGFHDGEIVDLVTHWDGDDQLRQARNFRIVDYQTPRGSAAAYYPETNTLLGRSDVMKPPHAGGQQPAGADDHHTADPEPLHLS